MAVRGLPVGIQTSRVSPAYLHGNSTSHTWAFSAVAELIDNAYDPDVNASEIWIDQRTINGKLCLTFVDNGNGMTPEKLHKMLSFGYCEKNQFSTKNHQAVGQYGNGFKSGSMRLGKDGIVFTRQANSMSVGLLSQTYLKNINAETVLTPIVTWTLPDRKRRQTADMASNLRAICTHSIFNNERSLLEELDVMEKLRTGTKIIIYNLTRRGDNTLELDFSSDPTDIRNPETHRKDYSTINRVVHEQVSAYLTSLREYCSILYLKPRMKIVLRGKKVKTKLIQKSLSQTETDVYRPSWAPKPIPIKFGFASRKNPTDYGIMLYHRNRLIRAYEKVGYQKQPNELGIGVVGVIEAYFLTPTHNKQDFNKDDQYNAFISSVSQKLNDYWNEKMGITTPGSAVVVRPPQQHVAPDWTWAQCDNCLQWRRLPIHIRADDLPEKWFCHMNPDAQFNRCDINEEPEDEDEALLGPTYKKTFKKQQNEKKQRLKLEVQNQQRMKELALQAKEHKLQQMEKEMQQKRKVPSSEEKPRNSQAIVRMERTLLKYEKQAEAQRKIIEELRKQKQGVEENLKSIEKVASEFKIVPNQDGSSSTEVTSTSSKGKDEKICIKTEDGDVVAVIPCESSTNSKSQVVDLTIDSEDEDSSPTAAKKQKLDDTNDKDVDVKPDISKIKIEKDTNVKSYKDTAAQTTCSGKTVSEAHKKAEESRSQLLRLQRKVFKLLKIIVPDEDIGTPDGVEDIVTEMIKHNQPSSSS